MSFLKKTDPAKREFIVEEFLKSKRIIKQNTISEKLGDIGMQRELAKFYKPITESQAGLAATIIINKRSNKGNSEYYNKCS